MLAWLSENEGVPAYVVFALASMLEYLVPPIPGDAIALFGIFLTVSAGWSTPAVYAALNAGSLCGGMLAYAVGLRLHDPERRPGFLRGPRASAALAELSAQYARYGAVYLAANRFVPALRAFFFVAAGIAGLPVGRVALWGAASALVWNAILIAAGHALGASYAELASGVGTYTVVVLVVLALLTVAGVWRWLAGRTRAPQTTAPGAEAPGAEARDRDRAG